MKILVLTTRVPFIHGGAEQLRDHLVRNLRLTQGIEAEAISLPFTWEPAERLLDEMMIARAIELSNADRVIALKFPSYLVPHYNKVIWLVHQYRQAYDLWDAGQSNIPTTARGETIRSIIRAADERAFDEARAIFTVSPVILERLQRYHGRSGTVLSSPLNDPEQFVGGPFEGYVFAGGRVGRAKRQALLVRALVHAPGVRLVVAGPPDTDTEARELEVIAEELGISDRLILDIRFLPRTEYAALLNSASAVVYIPFDEDSAGYVTLEAGHAGKPVLTTNDSGGVLEVVRHNETGYVVEPTPEAIGAAMVALVDNAARSREMGAAGRELMGSRGLTWEKTIESLLA